MTLSFLSNIQTAFVRFADRNAFCIADRFYTYRQFGQCVERIRETLRCTQFSCPYVGLIANDDIETYASIFAVWFERLAYIPISTEWPQDRRMSVIRQADIEVILDSGSVVRTDGECIEPAKAGDSKVSTDCACILFTSGSTGRPKGVEISRRNIQTFVDSLSNLPVPTTPEDRVLFYYDLTFVASFNSLLRPLAVGACCYTIPKKVTKYLYISKLMEDQGITQMSVPVSALKLLQPYYAEIDASSLKYCIVGTEACTVDVVENWMRFAPQASLFNYYGSTECLGVVMYYPALVERVKNVNGYVSIGRPLSSVTALILDEWNNEVPVGERGELCISGDNVTPGYWKDGQSNADAFFEMEYRGRMHHFYRTGDICFMDEEGDVMNCGRKNQMIKVNGLRVEMNEIEFHAVTYLGGAKVVCMPFESALGSTQICLFAETEPVDEREFLAYLRTKMPPYMIPARFIYVSQMPLTASGKTDRQKLLTFIDGDGRL